MDDVLKIATLGGLSLQLGGQPVRGFVSRKVEALLVYLAANPREHPREVLGELLWDDLPQNRTMSYLRTALSSLQQQLAPYLLVSRQSLSINPESNYWLDIQVLEEALNESEAEWEQRGSFSRLTAGKLEAAVELYKGAFLEGFHIRDARGFEGWMILEQERLRSRVLDALHHLGEHCLQRAQYSTGIAHVNRALQLDPLSEPAHRLMMMLLAQSGQRSAAIAQFEHCRKLIEAELGVEPEDETYDLYERIMAGEISVEAPAQSPHNLPALATAFIDRPRELQFIIEQMERLDCRMLTLVGPGGIGKTRLALEAARLLLPEYAQGVYFVPFAPLNRPDFIPRTIANALNITFKGEAPLEDELIKHLGTQEILLVIDNFEHLVEAADILSRILAGAPSVKMLVTSRERLNLQEEWLYHVEALEVPANADDPEAVMAYPAIQLFVQAVKRVQPDFDCAQHLPAIIHICRLVEGMPLGIELAASWVRVMSCEQIIQEITTSLDFLTTSLRNIPERHRSIRAVFDSSWSLLNAEEQRVMRQLSVFCGGFQPEAARTVTGASLLTLSSLLDKSLLHQVDGRYQIHEMLRQYAGSLLQEHPAEMNSVRTAHTIYYADYFEAREARLTNNRQDSTYGEVLDEIDNITAAWQHAMETDPEIFGRFLRPLYRLLDIQSRYLDGERIFRTAAERLKSASGSNDMSLLYARAVVLQASCLQNMTRYLEAEPLALEVLPVFREHNALWELRIGLACLGAVVYAKGEYRQAQQYFEEVYHLARQTDGDTVIILLRLSDLAMVLGEYEKARGVMERALRHLKDSGGQQNRMRFLLTLGDINCKLGNFDEAWQNFQEARELSETLNAASSGAVARVSLGRVAYGTANYAESAAFCRQSIEMFEAIHNNWGKAFALMHLGRVNYVLGNLAEAASEYQAGLEIADKVGSPWLTSSILRQLANVNAARENTSEAHHNLHESLRIAISIKALPLAMDAIAGIAAMCIEYEPELACELAAFVLAQPFSEYETLQAAGRTLELVQQFVPVELMEEIMRRALDQSLEDFAGRLLSPTL
jgi:predicted ATPase/DNA-binding SARP family transcriptional activator